MAMSGGVSVVICCHNSARRLPETLRHLAAQEVPAGVAWEVLIIDNASSDDTAVTARRCWPVPSPVPLRIVNEPRLGIGTARFRSFTEASYDIVSFLDDDNWVGPDWIKNVADFFREHQDASAVGGPSRAAHEDTPPPWFAGVSGAYAIGSLHSSGDITESEGTLLWTAGMSLRREKALELVARGFRFIACGGSLLALKTGEDVELCYALRALGGRIYFDSRFAIEHFMPKDRLTWPKALKLLRIGAASSVLFDLYLIALERPPFAARPAWRNSWGFYLAKALRDFFQLLLLHSGECLRKPEGSAYAIAYEKTLGRLETLWAFRGQYQKLRHEIRHASWNLGKR
jgi:glycosyltransferase involved in cell wall biosynthesis